MQKQFKSKDGLISDLEGFFNRKLSSPVTVT